MVRLHREEKGVALLLTILIISLIVVVTLQFNTSMRSEVVSAANTRDGIRLSCIARSGVNYALAVLFEDAKGENQFDSLQEAWADSALMSANSAMMFEEGQFEVQILDHSGRIQINQLVNENGEYNTRQKELLTRFLRSEEFDLDEEQVNTIVSSIKDWIDPDNEATDFGAEAFYYQALERPHSCRNGPLESLADLLLIRGITKELFYGTTERPGISNYLTVQGGDGRININTASPLVLRALSDRMDEDRAENMVKYRQDEKDLKDPKWYTKVPEMNDIFLDPDLITTKSTYFEILSKASIGPMAKQVRTMVERKEGEVKILSWKVE